MDADKPLDLGFAAPTRILSIGVTGHREGNATFGKNRAAIEQAISTLLSSINQKIVSSSSTAKVRLVTNLANGCDLMASQTAAKLDFDLIAPLPFGSDVNLALNMLSTDWPSTASIADGNEPKDTKELANWSALKCAYDNAICFELCDQDTALKHYLKKLAANGDDRKLRLEFESLVGKRTKLASRITVEQSDILLAIWDGASPTAMGGTRDTMAEALSADVPVIWLDARKPDQLTWLDDLGDLAIAVEREASVDAVQMTELISANIHRTWQEAELAKDQLNSAAWHPHSKRRFHAYRRIERMFSGSGSPFAAVKQSYETPQAAASDQGQTMIGKITALLHSDSECSEALAKKVVSRFAASDGISTYLSDAYRGGMVANFLLSAAAIIAGVAYLPLVGPEGKWPFALLELTLLLAIVAITVAGVRGNWHRRWFQTRRAAEYLRHAPIMVAIGCGRPRGHWPSSPDTPWPELYAREVIKSVGMPHLKVTQPYLKAHLRDVLYPFFIAQREYHREKAHRLGRVHHNLDKMSETLFILAIVSVSAYLMLKLSATLGMLGASVPDIVSKPTTFLGVAFPTLGAAIARHSLLR
ncbi:hypothetical protein ACRAQ7_14160 [Erythrobacter sp. W53]|uniref:hypothetical protein n=1 Tax=Erythrobacter sp. W53 TaxID=3425947 RepID=UPI003D76A2F9